MQFTRSRPYHKNDNAHLEQKNWTHVRCLLGYERLENAELLEPINALYRDAWALYHNHFCPSMKLVEKRREGARQIKRYDAPKTPYHRLAENAMLDEQKRTALERQHAALNPFVLKRQIEAGLKQIQRLVRVGKRSKPNLTTKVA